MRPGKEYELFVYEKLKKLFPDPDVKHDDHILGKESGLSRQIDVSVRIPLDPGTELLYVVQCKDWATRADINAIGELVAVIQDVGAAKGFLLCTSGFAKTNYRYALTKGIELVTIEDIQSDKWTTDVEIPLVYTQKNFDYSIEFDFEATEELVEANREAELHLVMNQMLLRAPDLDLVGLEPYVSSVIESTEFQGVIGQEVELGRRGLEVQLAGMWVPVSKLSVTVLDVKPHRYLKYLRPDEYSHIRDHARGEVLPLHVRLSKVPMQVDETFIELGEHEIPVTPGLWLDVETWTQVEANSRAS